MRQLPPYADTLGIEAVEQDGEHLYRMPFADTVLGRPGYLHGGAIAGLLELAGIATLMRELDDQSSIKPVNMSVTYMRGGTAHETFAAATIARIGGRVANVEVHAWQADRAKPIASAQLNLLIRRAS